MSVVFCGTAVGRTSARVGAYYARPGNQFWSVLYEIGLTPRRLQPHEYVILPESGIGLTDLVKVTSGTDAQINDSDFDVDGLRIRIEKHSPRVVAFNGKRGASEFLGRAVNYELQEETIAETNIFVLPSTSGAARGYWDQKYWVELAAYVRDSTPTVTALSIGRELSDAPARRQREMAAHCTQPITAADIKAGRIRVPVRTKPLFPQEPAGVKIELRGERKSCHWNPHYDRDKQRSGVLGIGKELMRGLSPESEPLRIRVAGGVFFLD